MGAATTCDHCGKLGAAPPVGWVLTAEVEAPVNGYLSSIFPAREPVTPHAVLCSWACVVEFAYLKAVEASMVVADEPAAPEAGETP